MRVRSLLVLMAAVAIGFGVVIWFGFWIHEKTNAIPDNIFGAAAYVAIFGIAFFLTCLALKISPFSGWTVREMFGPKAAKGRVNVAGGKRSPAERTAYFENPKATVTCAHLQPIERAMRKAGVEVRLGNSEYSPIIKAACRIREAELTRVFQLPPAVHYRQGYSPERYEFDNPWADIICGYCEKSDRVRCQISVLHPDQCREDTPWFPGAESGGSS